MARRKKSAKETLPSTSRGVDEKTTAPVEDEGETVAEEVVVRGEGVGVEGKGKGKEKEKETAPESETPAEAEAEAEAETAALGMKVETVARMEMNSETDSDTDSEGTWNIFPPSLGVELGNGGIILVLFETPSGFAILSYDGVTLRLPRAIEDIWADFMVCSLADSVAWLKEFQTFEDKTSAINPVTGVSEQLAMMIRNYIVPGQKLAVGKLEYKNIIEDKLGIVCLFDDTVMELMWGLKTRMHHLVPGEKEELTKEDRQHMSEGMKIVLDRYKFEVEPEMVNEKIIRMTGIVYSCDLRVNKFSESLQAAGEHLMEISNIDSQHWDLFKVATAFKIICFPQEKLPGNPLVIFSQDKYSKLVDHGHMYEGKILKPACKMIFEEILDARRLRNRVLGGLAYYVREARKEYEAGQGLMNSN